MKTDFYGTCAQELDEMSRILELINYRPRTADAYLYALSHVCEWLERTYHISINDASVVQLREYLLYLKRPLSSGGRGYKPRTINVHNCVIRRYFQYVLKKPLDNRDLPLMRVEHRLPSVPSKKDTALLISGIKNLKHKTMLALAYGCALRVSELVSLRFGDISFSSNLVTIRAEVSKNRCEENVELPANLKSLLKTYFYQCCRGAKSDDWLFPGQKKGSHISKGTPPRILEKRLAELGWLTRGYTMHSLRHGHALHYYLAGADIYQVQVRLRHRSIYSTTIYVRLAGRMQERRNIENPFDDPSFRF